MSAEVEYYLRYDRGQYTHLAAPPHQSLRFSELVAEVQTELARYAGSATSVVWFWRDDPIE